MRLTVSVHALAGAACLFNALPIAVRGIAITLVTMSFLTMLRKIRRASRPIELCYSDAGGWTMRNGEELLPVELFASTVSLSWVVILHYRILMQNQRTLMIFRDSLTAEEYRKLKVALRIAVIS